MKRSMAIKILRCHNFLNQVLDSLLSLPGNLSQLLRKDGFSDKIESVLKEPRIYSHVIVEAIPHFSVKLKGLLINVQVTVG